MKSLSKLLTLGLVLAGLAATSAFAHVKAEAGPNGGRVLTSVKPKVEFFVTKDRHVQFTFLDAKGQPVAPQEQTITLTTGSRSAPTVLTFARQGDVLLSETALPAGQSLPAVIQIKTTPSSAEKVERLNINLGTCPECKHAEYACICGH